MTKKKTTTKKKPTKEELAKKMEKKCKEMWSKIVRSHNGGLCSWCKKNKAQNAHHWFINKARSKALQFKELNGLPLCYGCHIHIIHKEASVINAIELLNIACSIYGIKKENLLDMLYRLSFNGGKKYSYEDLEDDFARLCARMKELGVK